MSSVELFDVAGRRLDLETLREQIAPGASDPELAHFARVCNTLDLSPWAGQIVCIGRNDRRVGRTVFRPQITVAGRRVRAERTGRLSGIDGPYWCAAKRPISPELVGDLVIALQNRIPSIDIERVLLAARGEPVWRDLWEYAGFPYAARVFVHRHDWDIPSNGTVTWNEFAQYTNRERGELAPLWQQMPSHMLGKSAESLALRRAFPDDVAYRLAVSGATTEGDETSAAILEADADTWAPEPPAGPTPDQEPQRPTEPIPDDDLGRPY
ncbi:MAG: recombinase RecT [Actinobacteria bacterium]|nr:recombinase RecT [Actinomycetota bacterium]